MIDVGSIEAAIDQVAEQRARLDRLEAWLREGAAILGNGQAIEPETPALPPPPPEPELAGRPSAPVRRTRRSRTEVDHEVARIVREIGPCLHIDVVRAGVAKGTVSHALERMVRSGRLLMREEQRGHRLARLYEVNPEWGRTERGQQIRQRKETSQAESRDRVQVVVDRRTVLKAILADDGDLTEAHLAMATGFDDEKIAEACAWLVENHHATVDELGRYSRGNRCPL